MDNLEPRQILFLKHYLDPKSKTFSNALQSALEAGYTKEYAENITHLMPDWLSDAIGDSQMLKKAEDNLRRAMEIPVEDKELGERSLKASMFVAKGIGKAKYSERSELTGPGGKELPTPILGYVSSNNSDPQSNGDEQKN